MPRKRRLFLPDVPVQVVQIGNNRQAISFDHNDYRGYLSWLGSAASTNGCAIHAYALMTNHVHPEERRGPYRALFAAHLDPDLIRDVRACLQTGTPLGNDRFRTQIERPLGVKVGYSARGRPKQPPKHTPSGDEQLEMQL